METSVADTIIFTGKPRKQQNVTPKSNEINTIKTEYKFAYDMGKKGLAVIFNHYKFYKHFFPTDETERLKKCFEKLNFETILFNDMDHRKIENYIAEVQEKEFSCLIVVVITVGDSKSLQADDRGYKPDELWNSLGGKFIGIPKIFFLQACPKPRSTIEVDGQDYSPRRVSKVLLPVTADFLHVYSSYEDYDSSLCSMWFITALISVIEENYGNDYNILQLLTLLNHKLKSEYVKSDSKKSEQMPHIVSTLTKILKFKIAE